MENPHRKPDPASRTERATDLPQQTVRAVLDRVRSSRARPVRAALENSGRVGEVDLGACSVEHGGTSFSQFALRLG